MKVTPELNRANPLDLDPFMLDPARVFHYGNALVWLNQKGVKQVGIERDWTLTIHTSRGKVVKVPPMVLVTRDRRYAMEHLQSVINGDVREEATFHVDTYDKEFHGLIESWKDSA